MVKQMVKGDDGKMEFVDRDAKYFAREASKLASSVNGSKERVQVLTIEAMHHAETHGDWTGSLLPIMEVVLNGPNKAAGVFGNELGRAFAVYVTKYTKLVYNPKGLNGRKLNKLPIAERWAWDRTKSFDVAKAVTEKWWTLKRDNDAQDEKPFDDDAWTAKANRFVVSIQSLIDDGKVTEQKWPAYRDELIAKLNKVKFPAVVAGRAKVDTDGTSADDGTGPLMDGDENDGRTGTNNPARVVDEQENKTEKAA